MAYVPNNTTVFLAAYIGAISGMAASGRVLTDQDPAGYDSYTTIAGAYAQAFDTLWGAMDPTTLEADSIREETQAVWLERTPMLKVTNKFGQQVTSPFYDPLTYYNEINSIIALIASEENYFTAQGIPDTIAAISGNVLVFNQAGVAKGNYYTNIQKLAAMVRSLNPAPVTVYFDQVPGTPFIQNPTPANPMVVDFGTSNVTFQTDVNQAGGTVIIDDNITFVGTGNNGATNVVVFDGLFLETGTPSPFPVNNYSSVTVKGSFSSFNPTSTVWNVGNNHTMDLWLRDEISLQANYVTLAGAASRVNFHIFDEASLGGTPSNPGSGTYHLDICSAAGGLAGFVATTFLGGVNGAMSVFKNVVFMPGVGFGFGSNVYGDFLLAQLVTMAARGEVDFCWDLSLNGDAFDIGTTSSNSPFVGPLGGSGVVYNFVGITNVANGVQPTVTISTGGGASRVFGVSPTKVRNLQIVVNQPLAPFLFTPNSPQQSQKLIWSEASILKCIAVGGEGVIKVDRVFIDLDVRDDCSIGDGAHPVYCTTANASSFLVVHCFDQSFTNAAVLNKGAGSTLALVCDNGAAQIDSSLRASVSLRIGVPFAQNGDPTGVVTGQTGCLVVRKDAASASTTLYIYSGVTGTANWNAVTVP